MSTLSPSPRAPTPVSRPRGESEPPFPQTAGGSQSLLPVGGFALKAIAHIKPPKGVVQS